MARSAARVPVAAILGLMRHIKRDKPTAAKPFVGDGAARDGAARDAAAIDALYGLEPVFEPDEAGAEVTGDREQRDSEHDGSRFRNVSCPYCGECFETLVDLSAGSADYIEDCQVCCRPIQFHLEVDHEGRLIALTTSQGD